MLACLRLLAKCGLVISVLVRSQLGLGVGIDYVRETLSHTRNVTKVSQDCSTVW